MARPLDGRLYASPFFLFPCENLVTNFISGPSLPDITLCCHAMLHLRKTLFLGEGLGGHGGLRYCGIELFFSSGISVILILMSGIAVSSSPAVCGFSSFWVTVFGKRRSSTVLRYRSFGLSFLM